MYEIAENLVIAFERAYTENIQTGSGGPLFGAMLHLHSLYIVNRSSTKSFPLCQSMHS